MNNYLLRWIEDTSINLKETKEFTMEKENYLYWVEDFKKVLKYSQGIENPIIDDLIDKWYEGKKDFIKLFGGQLIYTFSKKVKFELSIEERNARFAEFLDYIYDNYNYEDLIDFLNYFKIDFFKDGCTSEIYTKGNIKIPKGMKIVKAFKFFIKNQSPLENIQNMASRLIQNNKIEGQLCFSVHPLDFLSSSENTHNWRSCHALNGEYRAGNLSYMVDSSTIICYLRSDDGDKILPRFPKDVLWNSKKWRMLLFFSETREMLFAGRQYPFESAYGLQIILDILTKKLHFGSHWTRWSNRRLTSVFGETLRERYYLLEGYLIPENDLIHDNKNSMHYNDLKHSSTYIPYYTYQSLWVDLTKQHFSIGGEVKCIRCGGHPINMDNSMLCNSCYDEFQILEDDFKEGYVCEICGGLIPEGDEIYAHFGEDGEQYQIICPDCGETETHSCSNCGAVFFNSDLTYLEDTDEFICAHCYNSIIKKEN